MRGNDKAQLINRLYFQKENFSFSCYVIKLRKMNNLGLSRLERLLNQLIYTYQESNLSAIALQPGKKNLLICHVLSLLFFSALFQQCSGCTYRYLRFLSGANTFSVRKAIAFEDKSLEENILQLAQLRTYE